MSEDASRLRTIGVEEEFQVVDPTSRRTTTGAGDVLAAIKRGEYPPEHFQSEIHTTMLETCTPPVTTLAQIDTHLRSLRAIVKDAARRCGLAVATSATLPVRGDNAPHVLHEPRYEQIERLHAGIVAGMSTCGVHVHVEVDDRDLAVAVMNRCRRWLPALLAISGNSPYWDGRDTGFDSYRTVIWGRWPSATLPEPFTGAAQYDAVVEALIDSGAILDNRQIYWDIRLSPAHPTLEFRIGDVGLTVEDSVLYAGLCLALVETSVREVEAGLPEPRYRPELLRAAKWRAARFGLTHTLLDLDRRVQVPAEEHLESLLAHVSPVLAERGELQHVTGLLDRLRERGTGAQRQRAAHSRRGRFDDVVDYIVEQT